MYIDNLEIMMMTFKKLKNPVGGFVTYLKEREKLHGRSYAIDELDICSEYLLAPEKFSTRANNREGFMFFSPMNQGFFDDLYRSKAFRFTEDAMTDPKRYFSNAPKDWDEDL